MMRKFGQSEIIDVPKLVRENKEKWVNINLTEVNDAIVRLGIFEGEFHWHKHNLEQGNPCRIGRGPRSWR